VGVVNWNVGKLLIGKALAISIIGKASNITEHPISLSSYGEYQKATHLQDGALALQTDHWTMKGLLQMDSSPNNEIYESTRIKFVE